MSGLAAKWCGAERVRIAHVLASAGVGGCEAVCLRVAGGLPADEHAFVFFMGGGPLIGRFSAVGSVAVCEGAYAAGLARFRASLTRMVDAQEADAVVVWVGALLPVVVNAVTRPGRVTLVHLGNPWVMNRVTASKMGVASLLWRARGPVRLVACSAYVARSVAASRYLRRFGLDVVPNPIDLSGVMQAPVRDLRHSETIRIGCVSRLDPSKDHATLIRAFARVVARHPNCRLELVGDGPARDSLVALAEACGVSASVEFRGTCLQVAEILPDWDILLSRHRARRIRCCPGGGHGGGPVVHRSARGAMPELDEPGGGALVYAVWEERALADTMIEVIGAPIAWREAIARRAAARAGKPLKRAASRGSTAISWKPELPGRTMGSVYVAAVGDANSLETFSGIPASLVEAGKAAGWISGGLPLSVDTMAWRVRRVVWTARRLVTARERGGFQYSTEFLERLWKPVRNLVEGGTVINCVQLYPPSIVANARCRKWFFIDQTLAQGFAGYGFAHSVGRAMAGDAVRREREGYGPRSGSVSIVPGLQKASCATTESAGTGSLSSSRVPTFRVLSMKGGRPRGDAHAQGWGSRQAGVRGPGVVSERT